MEVLLILILVLTGLQVVHTQVLFWVTWQHMDRDSDMISGRERE